MLVVSIFFILQKEKQDADVLSDLRLAHEQASEVGRKPYPPGWEPGAPGTALSPHISSLWLSW